jgi:hypothetical protein
MPSAAANGWAAISNGGSGGLRQTLSAEHDGAEGDRTQKKTNLPGLTLPEGISPQSYSLYHLPTASPAMAHRSKPVLLTDRHIGKPIFSVGFSLLR